jgi:CHAT domain-containing protein/tetratricopeptide (TPR) repeat protein
MKILSFVLLAVAPASMAIGQSQEPAARSSGRGDYYYHKGVEQFYLSYDSSEHYFMRALPYLRHSKAWEKYVECYNYLSALNYYRGNLETAGYFIYKAETEAADHLPPESSIRSVVMNNKGAFYSKIGEYKEAGKHFKRSMALERNEHARSSTVAPLYNMGIYYEKLGDFDKAVSYYRQAVQIIGKSMPGEAKDLAKCYYSIGNCFQLQNDLEQALVYFQKARRTLEDIEPGDYLFNQRAILLNSFAEVYLHRRQAGRAMQFAREALKLQENPKVQYRYLSYANLAEALALKGETQGARTAYRRSVKEAVAQYRDFNKHPVLAHRYTELAQFEAANGRHEEALHFFQEALQKLSFEFENDDIHALPDPLLIISSFQGIEILEGKAQSLTRRFWKRRTTKDLQTALKCYQAAHELIQKTRREILSSSSKYRLAAQAYQVYEGGVLTAFRLYNLTGKEHFLHEAWRFAESNKAMSLLETLQENLARNYSGLPDSLRIREREFRMDIAFFERNINEEKQLVSGRDQGKIDEWEAFLFQARKQYEDFIDMLEEHYPRYYHLKYDTRIASVDEVQQLILGERSALVEYFAGDDHFFAFRITRHNIGLIELPGAGHDDPKVNTLLELMRRPDPSGSNLDEFSDHAHSVFKQYLDPVLGSLPQGIDRLFIIPDGVLSLLPFEVLITKPASAATHYGPQEIPYLAIDYPISYSYSGALLLNSIERRKLPASKPILALAPSFSYALPGSERDDPAATPSVLPFSLEEAKAIVRLLGGKEISGLEATRQRFLEEAEQYNILHLATHSATDEDNPMLSRIFFSDGALSSYDLFNLELRAEMAVLSSCNTGSGRYVRGEGVMSLARVFMEAGVPSAVISLWAVDDYATADIMVRFYQNLQAGMAKDEALQRAKRGFLRDAGKARRHPYYWAAFVQMGNPDALEGAPPPQTTRRPFVFVALIVLLLAGFVVMARRRGRS